MKYNRWSYSYRPAQKYGNKKVYTDDGEFDSKIEYARWCELKLLARSGKITDLRRQVPFELIPSQREPDTIGKRGGIKPGKVIERAVTYIADFVYTDSDGQTVVEDTKGIKTDDYIIKRKLMLWRYNIKIVEITKKG